MGRPVLPGDCGRPPTEGFGTYCEENISVWLATVEGAKDVC